jgi:L-lactate utilization protein LutC
VPLHSPTAKSYAAVTVAAAVAPVYSPTPVGTFLTDMFEATARKQQHQQQQQCSSSAATSSHDGYADDQLCELQQTVSSMRAQCMRTLGTAAMDEVYTTI